MTRMVEITVDVAIARRMLCVAGFSCEEITGATDDEIFEKVLSLSECYGMKFEMKERKHGSSDQ